jgi:hypothetical protein
MLGIYHIPRRCREIIPMGAARPAMRMPLDLVARGRGTEQERRGEIGAGWQHV